MQNRLDDSKYKMKQNMSLDRLNHTDFRTDLYFAVTSSRLMKATLEGMKIIKNCNFNPAKTTRSKTGRVQCYKIKFS